ncbi:MAG: nucleotidyl transferase [Gammaproteobacteria bacterium RIFCSPHIGHO2_12_FULL_43_28]|nr:MAG: nucleotidyl transferase [Gammaproteobacteria bacterium RIFCSPHIGHO2_12_FULL_43_28]
MKNLFPAVILAGGLATRLRPVTEKIPKSLIEINNEPFIAHQLGLLYEKDIRRVILCIGYLGDKIRDYVGDGSRFGLEVSYVQDGPQLLGTGGAIKRALPQIENAFFVLYGDSYLNCDYAAVQTAYVKSQKLGLMTVFHNENLWDTSNIEYSDGEILAYDKTNRTERMRYIDYGLGLLNASAFQYAPCDQAFDLALIYQQLLQQHQLAAYEVTERFYEVGSFAGIEELGAYLKRKCQVNPFALRSAR